MGSSSSKASSKASKAKKVLAPRGPYSWELRDKSARDLFNVKGRAGEVVVKPPGVCVCVGGVSLNLFAFLTLARSATPAFTF